MQAATNNDAHDMCDAVLAEEIAALVIEERRIHARLLALLEVFDRRGLAATARYPSTAAWLRATHRLDPVRRGDVSVWLATSPMRCH